MLTNNAPLVWKYLKGVVCLYKPSGYTIDSCCQILQQQLADDLNSLQCREPKNYVTLSGDTTKPLEIVVGPNYADHPLVVGPRYIPEEIPCTPLKSLGDRTSGVCLIAVNKSIQTLEKLVQHNHLSIYHVVGKFGVCTHNKSIDGRVLYTSNYNYLRKSRVDQVIAGVQAIHRKHLMKQCGYHPQSQQAYELIASGNLRPLARNIPVIYSIKCIDWNLPRFTLEIVIANEEEDYLLTLIDEIGLRARNIAVAESIRCLRYSIFSAQDTLLHKHWTLQYVIDNMKLCQQKLESIGGGDFSQNFERFDNAVETPSEHTVSDMDEEDLEEEQEA